MRSRVARRLSYHYSAVKLRPAFFRTVLSSVLAGVSLVWVDAQVRVGWPYIPVAQHWLWSLVLYAAVGALLGALGFALLRLERLWGGDRPLWVRAGFFAALVSVPLASLSLWLFSGEAASRSRWAQVGPALALLVGTLGVWGAGWLALRVAAGLQKGERLLQLLAALCCPALALQISKLDLTQYVALYGRLHMLLELTSWLTFTYGYALALALLERRTPAASRPIAALAVALLALPLSLLVSADLRTRLEGGLRHVWLEEVYVGRMLRRLQLLEAFARDPSGFQSLPLSRLEGLRKRYGFTRASVAPKWHAAPPVLEPEVRADLWGLRDPLRRYNIVVYYVDTLRGDVARDPSIMPNVVEFGAGAVRFPRAYSAGSDTLRSLPVLTGGNYDFLSTPKNDLLRVARGAGYESTLVIPKSAQYFLAKLRPEFRFDRTLAIADHPEDQEVWGYGANQSTAARVVDRALEVLDEPRRKRQPQLLWLFNFDVHNWRELASEHIEAAARRFGIREDPNKLAYRYRAAAAALDAEFGRFVLELEHRQLLDSTVILFLSDHGEALGRDGFWVHSVFLWEPLVRVPLFLKAPGLPARDVQTPVSLVDVAPTLSRYMSSSPNLGGYDGQDLLLNLTQHPPRRHLPILLVAASKDVLARVGVIDAVRDFKLVLSLEAALPELYDLSAPDPDGENVADAHPELTERLLREVVESPVFPRSLWDFEVRDTKEQRSALGLRAE